MHLERAERVLVESRDEHDHRHALGADRLQHAETVELRHLHVEEDEVRPVGANHLDRRRAIAALGDDLDVSRLSQQPAHPPPRDRLIVRDEGSQGHTSPAGLWSVCHGMDTRATVPDFEPINSNS